MPEVYRTAPHVHVAGQIDLDDDRKPFIKAYTRGKDDRTVFLTLAAVDAIEEPEEAQRRVSPEGGQRL